MVLYRGCIHSVLSDTHVCRWCGKGGFAQLKCTMDQSVPQWYDENFPPLAIYHGGRDFLVATDPLLERIKKHEPTVKLLRVQSLAESEVRALSDNSYFYVPD